MDQLTKNNITHILAIHDNAQPVLEVHVHATCISNFVNTQSTFSIIVQGEFGSRSRYPMMTIFERALWELGKGRLGGGIPKAGRQELGEIGENFAALCSILQKKKHEDMATTREGVETGYKGTVFEFRIQTSLSCHSFRILERS